MRRQFSTTILTLIVGTTFANGAGDSAYDRIDADLGKYLDHHDPLSFAMKIKSISSDEYTFFRGTKDMFYQWSKTNCADWLADRDAYVISHGDLHLGNIGTYTTDWGKLAFGMIDFDESARLPFQLELLQGQIAFDLMARKNQVTLTLAQHQMIVDTLLNSYAAALTSTKTATEMLSNDAIVRGMLEAPAVNYAKDVKKYVENGRFKTTSGSAKETNILLPLDYGRFDAFAAAIAQAAQNDPKLAALLKWQDEPAIRGAMMDVARRIRLGSSGSQGLSKYFVLLRKPFKNYDGDVVIYLKREIPSAAERVGAIPIDSRPPGQRYMMDMDRLCNPPALFNSWATLEGGSYWVTFKEPWSAELAYASVDSYESMRELAFIWGTTAGTAHGAAGDGAKISALLTPTLRQTLSARAAAYGWENAAAYQSFINDPRVKDCDQAIRAAIRN